MNGGGLSALHDILDVMDAGMTVRQRHLAIVEFLVDDVVTLNETGALGRHLAAEEGSLVRDDERGVVGGHGRVDDRVASMPRHVVEVVEVGEANPSEDSDEYEGGADLDPRPLLFADAGREEHEADEACENRDDEAEDGHGDLLSGRCSCALVRNMSKCRVYLFGLKSQ